MENTENKLTIDEIIKKLCVPEGNVVRVFLSSEVKKCMEYYLAQEMKEKDETINKLTDALKKYGRCKCRWTPEHGYKCRCGFDELVSEYEQKIKS